MFVCCLGGNGTVMGWEIGFDPNWQRDIGYGVPAVCDHPECEKRIDRGLAYVCGNGEPYGGDNGCGLYFCDRHGGGWLCERCEAGAPPFSAKPDIGEWVEFKRTDPSWAEWRALQSRPRSYRFPRTGMSGQLGGPA